LAFTEKFTKCKLMRFLNPLQEKVKKVFVLALKKKKPISLILIGEAGLGKTFIAKWYAKQLSDTSLILESRYVMFPELERREILEELKEVNNQILVIIDEIREPFISLERAKLNFDYLLSRYYEDKIPFVLIFNSEKDFKQQFSQVLISKIVSRAVKISHKPKSPEELARFKELKKIKKIKDKI
jgi:DNA replication protein DnaC